MENIDLEERLKDILKEMEGRGEKIITVLSVATLEKFCLCLNFRRTSVFEIKI